MKFLQINPLLVFVLVAFNFVYAQTVIPGNVSTSCGVELNKLILTPDYSTCASFLKLLPLQNTSDPKNVLDGYCSSPKCSDSTTNNSATELKNLCQKELNTSSPDPQLIALKDILIFNTPIEQSLCLKNSSGGYCYTDSDSSAIFGFLSGLNATNPPRDINCTDCNKAIVNTFVNFYKAHPESTPELPVSQQELNNFQTMVSTKCNSSFIDGKVPNNNNSQQQKSSGISMHTPSYTGFTMFANTIFVASLVIVVSYVI
ncbi:26670_t:CDS:2 [Dentiscutata erythropus]|uniref:26670_t:CDS:1 n=1 Tax=Dentiscutata erythropus TaxID=1348616 RepID=A0A9N8W8Q9_9GLOM|nr:26670_t:CDS:2 [Dentiscutata erythropus]